MRGGDFDDDVRIAVLRKQRFLGDLNIFSGHDGLGHNSGRRRKHRSNPRGLRQYRSLMRTRFHPARAQHPNQRDGQRDQDQIQQNEFTVQNDAAPFFSGTSLRGTIPETVRRTVTVLSFTLVALIRTSLAETSSGWEASEASKLIN